MAAIHINKHPKSRQRGSTLATSSSLEGGDADQKDLRYRSLPLIKTLRMWKVKDALLRLHQKRLYQTKRRGIPTQPCTSMRSAHYWLTPFDNAAVVTAVATHLSVYSRHKVLQYRRCRLRVISDSEWNTSIWIVPKKPDASGKTKWRLCLGVFELRENAIQKILMANSSDKDDDLLLDEEDQRL
ncbi:hypothetical protein EVAR_41426_1 [Eumeta japonica]|uniref:Uncharacterized protein n=1 Tax=Eumeta variegata TaxID=151549 RepID=A0A4C1W4Y9_EUMVA|nr:hypothetical protein EVAR_41426_1 [Eumeta japonica]